LRLHYHEPVDEDARRLSNRLREIGRITKLTGRVRLSRAYLGAIAPVEALAGNRSGADKAWVHEVLRSFRRHFRLVRNART